MTLTPAQKRAFDKLAPRWQSAQKIGERLVLLDRLVGKGVAERHYNPDSRFATIKSTSYRLNMQPPGLCENDVMPVLATSFPECEWKVRKSVLVFTLIARSGIVSYVLTVACDDLRTLDDIEQAGRESVAGLEDALRRYREEKG